MFLKRKISKRYFAVIIAVTSLFFLFNVFYWREPIEFTNNQYKIGVIEDAINSYENHVECRIPDIPVYSSEMLAFLKDESLIQCDDREPWVVCGTNKTAPWLCWIQHSIVDRLGSITCEFREVIRADNDYDWSYSDRVKTANEYILTNSDFVSVKCWTDARSDRKYWSGLLTGIRKRDIAIFKTSTKTKQHNALPFNVIIYGFDSLSKNAFIRKLPHTYMYLTKILQADVLQGYNIVGDGTPQAIIPLLTGFTELELPETRKRIADSEAVDIYPFIFKEFQRHGYVTAFNEDLPNVGTFSYRLNGFREQPTAHYMRSFYLALENELSYHKKLCVGDVARHNVMLDYTTKFMRAYNQKQPQLAFSFHGELSHDSINLVGVADDDIAAWLEDLNASGLLNNTVLLMMSDHGNRFAEVRNTLQGKLEERLPFFSFRFPDTFKRRFPNEYQQFKSNLNRLATPFDVHETIVDILRLQFPSHEPSHIQPTKPKLASAAINLTAIRAISLFKPIPKNRSCADAYIEPHWCSCLNLHPINVTTDTVQRAASSIVDRINDHTFSERKLCHRLSLTNITWAGKLLPHETLIKFKQNRDLDGYLADLTSTSTKITKDLYQIKVHTWPGDSIFEASLTHNLENNQFFVKVSDISRINVYGAQANCILKKNPDLRKFCYCRDTKLDLKSKKS